MTIYYVRVRYWRYSNIKLKVVSITKFSTKSKLRCLAPQEERDSLYKASKVVQIYMDNNGTITPSIINFAINSTLVTEHIIAVCKKVEKSGKV